MEKHLLLNCLEETRQLFCEFLTDANMTINCPRAKGKARLALWWLMEPWVFRGCPDGAGALPAEEAPLTKESRLCVVGTAPDCSPAVA